MARRARIDLMTGGIPQTGAGNAFDWPGGDGALLVESATFGGGSVALQIQGPSGTWVPVSNLATTATAVVTSVAGTPARTRRAEAIIEAARGIINPYSLPMESGQFMFISRRAVGAVRRNS